MHLARAIVVLPNDPEKRMRLLVRTANMEEPKWAYPCLPPGVRTLPRPNDSVWVTHSTSGELVWVGVDPAFSEGQEADAAP